MSIAFYLHYNFETENEELSVSDYEYEIEISEEDLIEYFYPTLKKVEFKETHYNQCRQLLYNIYVETDMIENWLEEQQDNEEDSDFYCWLKEKYENDAREEWMDTLDPSERYSD